MGRSAWLATAFAGVTLLGGCTPAVVHNPIATWVPSPNFNQRAPFLIVLHFTQEASVQQALHTLRTRNSGGAVSVQYLIGRDGHIYQLVADIDRAWQAGKGRWGTITDLNSASIGIELDNTGNAPFPPAQIDSLLRLLTDVTSRWHIPRTQIIGHEDLAPTRRSDPGQYFPWQELAAHGFGLWPRGKLVDPPAGFDPWLALAAIGYPLANRGAAVHAFHNQFRGSGSNSIPGNVIAGQPVHPWDANTLDPQDLRILYALVGPLSGRVTTAHEDVSAQPQAASAMIARLVSAGQFHAADARIAAALEAPDVSPVERTALLFQRARMQRIALDFSLTAEAVKAQVRKQIPGLTDAQFARWDAHGLLEHMVIDGEVRYFNRVPSNLFRLSAQARALRKVRTPLSPSGFPVKTVQAWSRYDQRVIHAATASGRSSVMPQRVEVTQSLTVDAGAVPAGQTLRAWIPYPQAIPGQQEDIRLVASVPAQHRIAPKATLQRTVYLQKVAQAGQPTVFSITYEVTLYAQYHAINPAKVVAAPITPRLAPYVAERAPHVVFTGPLRVFSRQIVGATTNPYRIAQKLFAAVDAIPWAGAREYSTIPDLGAYTLRAGHGDCGEQTMLLITLLRMNGIPARWQSGWTFSKGDYNDIHDWAQVYLAPYGWVPVDVTFGQIHSSNRALRWFYLGGLDNFRIAFNNGYGTAFVPAKQHFRSDTVDSQRGEVEWNGGNLYYNQWNYHFQWHILPVTPRVAK